MLRIPALLVVTYCAAFVLTSALAAPDRLRDGVSRIEGVVSGLFGAAASEMSAFDAADDVSATGSVTETPRARALYRADLWSLPPVTNRPARAAAPGEIELAGRGAIAIRDGDGNLVFLHDPSERTTTIARGATLPRLLAEPAGDEPRLDIAPPRPSGDTEPADTPDERLAPGCESAVSPLARSDVARLGVLCLAQL